MESIFHLLEDLFLMYIVYKIIFDFIIPIATTAKQVKKQFSDTASRMSEQYKQQNTQYTAQTKQPVSKPSNEDYIDFEEIK
jgi:sortase (surface protein transpeptidase)